MMLCGLGGGDACCFTARAVIAAPQIEIRLRYQQGDLHPRVSIARSCPVRVDIVVYRRHSTRQTG